MTTRILITNDDGVSAEGIRVLTRAATRLDAEITVVAPEVEHSAQSHAITVHKPIFVRDLSPDEGEHRRMSVEGTPCDCVRLALLKLLDDKPDLCLSGINHGGNLGWNVFHSGTVSAAAEAASFGVPSIALSLADWTRHPDWTGLDTLVAKLIRAMLKMGHSDDPWLYNVNLPASASDKVSGVRLTQQNTTVKGDDYEMRESPDGRKYFWSVWDDVKAARMKQTNPNLDTTAIREGFVSVTPLRYELTSERGTELGEQLKQLRL